MTGPIEDAGAGGAIQWEAWPPLVGFQRTQRRPSGACVVSSAQPKGETDGFLVSGTLGLFFGVLLFPQVKLLQERVITLGFGAVEVVEQAPTAADHGEKASAGGEVLHGMLKVSRKVVDSLREECDLHVGGTRVLVVETVAGDDLAFRGCGHGLKGNTYAKVLSSQCRKMGFDRRCGFFGAWPSRGGLGPRVGLEG